MVKKILLTIIIGVGLLTAPNIQAKTKNPGPEVRAFRFNPELKESLRETRDNFADFEQGLEPIVEKLSKLDQEYKDLKCNNSVDIGCRNLEIKMKAKFMEFLNSLKSRVDPLEASTKNSMARLHEHFKKLSTQTYPSDIAKEMGKKGRKFAPQGSMSKKLDKVLKLVGNSKISLVELASNTSLDLRMALEQLEAISLSIESQIEILEFSMNFGDIRSWMISSVSSVRSVLGLDSQTDIAPVDISQSPETDYLL